MIIDKEGIVILDRIFYGIKVIIIEKLVLVFYMIDIIFMIVMIKVGEIILVILKNM